MAKVLIVDDVTTIRRILTKILTEMGHEVVAEAANGQEAYNLYCEHTPDVVTMDISMPVMDGIDSVEMIVKKDPDAKVIMLTSQGMKDQVVKAIQMGAKSYLLKPIDKKNLQEAIEKLGVT
ncbi:MAG: response regulator [Ignavibacteriales bacterium]|jgi:two-component system, chemotaxis family, chemotaxis protein CheY|nr:response regulator [Ignavibacteriales bacterium]